MLDVCGISKVKVEVHSFTIGDVEDPDLYVAAPIHDWQQTDLGKWCMEHGTGLVYHISADPNTFGYRVTITGEFDPKYESFFILKKG